MNAPVQLLTGLFCLACRPSVAIAAVLASQFLHLFYLSGASSGLEYFGSAILCDFFALCVIYWLDRRLDLMVVCLLYILTNTVSLLLYTANGFLSEANQIAFAEPYKDCITIIIVLQTAVMLWGKSDNGGTGISAADSWRSLVARYSWLSHRHGIKGKI